MKEEQKADLPTFIEHQFPYANDQRFEFDVDQKKCHHWIYGNSNTGKTYFIQKLRDTYRLSAGSVCNNWIDFRHCSDIIYFDEFTGQIPIE